jgi:hypothetical protein
MMTFPTECKIKAMFQTTNQIWKHVGKIWGNTWERYGESYSSILLENCGMGVSCNWDGPVLIHF